MVRLRTTTRAVCTAFSFSEEGHIHDLEIFVVWLRASAQGMSGFVRETLSRRQQPFFVCWYLTCSWDRCAGVLVCWCAGVLVFWCACVLVCSCAGVLGWWCGGVVRGCAVVLVCLCAGVLVYWCAGVLMCWCAYVLFDKIYEKGICPFWEIEGGGEKNIPPAFDKLARGNMACVGRKSTSGGTKIGSAEGVIGLYSPF